MSSDGAPPLATGEVQPPPLSDADRHADRQPSSSIDDSGDDLFLDAFSSSHPPFAIGDDDDDDENKNKDPLFPEEVDDTTGLEAAKVEADIPAETDPISLENQGDDVAGNPEFSIGDDDTDDSEKEDSPRTATETTDSAPPTSTPPVPAAPTTEPDISDPPSTSPPVDFVDVDIGDKEVTADVSCEPTPSVTHIESTPVPVQAHQTEDKPSTVPETGSGESWEPVEETVTMSNAIQYEILPGLWAHMSDDAVVGFHDVDSYAQSDDDCQHFDVLISAKKVCLGCGSFLLGKDVAGDGYFITGRNVTLRASLEKPRTDRDEWDVVVRDLDISIAGGLELDPLAERAQVVSFLEKFGCTPITTAKKSDNNSGNDQSTPKQQTLPARRMTKEEWEQFMRNVREDKRAKETKEEEGNDNEADNRAQGASRDPSSIDFLVPYAKVWEVSCKLSKEKSIEFPYCEGTAKCTLRTLIEYYFRSILNTIDEALERNAELDGKTSVADMTSVKASIVGAAAGAAVLGPIGFLAGSYLGSQLGRKHSGTVVGATAGACLFGPVGLIAGACYGESARNLNGGSSRERPPAAFGQSRTEDSGGIAKAATEHVSSNKYEYAGTAGVVAGAAAGSVAGPIGMVAGAYLGSVSARKVTENASSAATEVSETEGRREYRFGDVTRGFVARGKQARGAGEGEGYQFGDFTRGLFSGGKGK